jgi:hypothetical protein
MFHAWFKPTRSTAAGAIAIGLAIAISSFGVVRAEHYSPQKKTTFSCSGGTACLTAQSSGANTYALYADGVSANTIQAETSATNGDSAVAGISNATSGRAEGLYGASNTGDGIYGITNAGSSSGYAGVYGLSTNSYGVFGQSTNEYGVYGESTYGYAGVFDSDAGHAATLYAQNSYTYGYPLEAYNSALDTAFWVDYDADGVFSGYVEALGGFKTVQRERDGTALEAFGPESTRATIEDTGTARLEGGEGAVRFDSAFAGTIDAARGYQVFLTPNGDTRGLYVAAKYEGGFIVRENEHGRSSVYFDYRVVAHPYGASDARLAKADVKRPPSPRLSRPAQP